MSVPDMLRDQNRRRLVYGGIACAVIVLVTLIVVVALRQGHGSSAVAGASPSATWSPLSWAPATTTEQTSAPSPVAANASCDDARAWAQDSEDSLLEGFINNQNSGNISGDEIKTGCPQYLSTWQKAQGGIGNGETHAVPGEVKPGTYETASSDIENCYWERSRNGQIIANNFITGSTVKQRVTIRSSDDTFVSRNCGDWVKVG